MKIHTVTSLLLASLVLTSTRARAYEYETHAGMTERAMEAMQLVGSLNPDVPDGVSAAEFNAYKTRIANAVSKLKGLRTGLPNKLQGGGVNPVLPIGPGDEDYPFQSSFKQEPDPNNPGQMITVELQPTCKLDDESDLTNDDLSDLTPFRVSEFNYVPLRTPDNGCGLTPLPDGTDNSDRVLRSVLGWHAGGVDDRANDTVMWIKPTNAAAYSTINDLAIEASNAALGAAVLLGYCFVKLFELEICDPDEAFALAEKYNPVTQALGLIPGFGDWRDADLFSGLWHFINVDRQGEGTHNDIPGMHYPHAASEVGLIGPGAADIAFMALADAAGLSVNAWASDGDDFYGQYDENTRLTPAWMAYSFVHVEFSPLDNLAKYGWEQYRVAGGATSLAGLGWPLHALGDAAAPHHVIGTSSYGHTAFEGATAANHDRVLPKDSGLASNQMRRILRDSFEWFQRFEASGRDVRALVEDVAFTTRSLVSPDSVWEDWPYIDIASVQDKAGDTEAAYAHYFPDKAVQIMELMEVAMSAKIALLVAAGEEAGTPPGQVVTCPAGAHFKIGTGCVGGLPLLTCPGELPQCTSTPCPSSPEMTCIGGCCLLVVQ